MIKNCVGNPVSGKNFFDRLSEQRIMWDALDTDNILLLAPRRVGKTSLMYRLRDDAPSHDYSSTYLSVAGATDELDFVRNLYAATARTESGNDILQQIVEGPVGKFFKNIKRVDIHGFGVEFKASAQKGWDQIGAALSVTLEAHDGRWLILMDEIPLFVMKLLKIDPSGKRARYFLDWFRNIRQSHESIRWILAGSIGLDTVVARLNMSDTINDLNLQRLGAFSDQTSHDFLKALGTSYGITLSQQIRSYIISRVTWTIPYFLNLLFSEIRGNEITKTIPPDKSDVDKAFANLLEPARKNYFDYWRQRLNEELEKPDNKIATDLLLTSARDPQGASRQTLLQKIGEHISESDAREGRLRYLLDILINDGYVTEIDGRYPFRSPLLREFWLRRIG